MPDNYQVIVRSRLDDQGNRLAEPRLQAAKGFVGILDALDYIQRTATVVGWRHFTLETIGRQLEVPLRETKVTKLAS